MKYLFAMMAFSFCTFGFAQVDTEPVKNTDVLSTTIITKTITETSEGRDVDVKRQVITAKEALALEQDGSTNQSMTRKPLVVTKTTSFVSDGTEYIIEPDAKGFVISIAKNGNEKKYAKLRKLSRPNAYLLITEKGNAFGYFDARGDFIMESYDPAKDMIVVDTFAINRSDLQR